MAQPMDVEVYRRDPIAFIRDFLRNPETGKPFTLYAAQVVFLRLALTLTADGRLPFAELLFGAIKKSGKTMIAAWCVLYVTLVLGGPYAEAYILSNDEEQARSRVFEAIVRLIRANPALKKMAKITEKKITFPSTGATITALASDFAGAAGAAPSIVVFDELWAYASERAHRLWDEMIPTPTKQVSVRLTVSYAGFSGESKLLEGLYQRGLAGEVIAPSLYRTDDGLLMFWSHEPLAPWQDERWLKQMRASLRPNAYLRMIENRFVEGAESFVDLAWWDAIATAQPVLAKPDMPVVVGVDLGLKHDSTGVVAVGWDDQANKPRIVAHRVLTPTEGQTLDIAAVERYLLDLSRRFSIVQLLYDPWQFQRSAQTLSQQGINCVEFAQNMGNLTSISSTLFEALKGQQLIGYASDEIRSALAHAVIIEGSRGARIGKEKSSHRVDAAVALAMAVYGATEQLAAAGGAFDFGAVIVSTARSGLDGIKRIADNFGQSEARPGDA